MARRTASPCALVTVEPPGAAWPHVDALVRELVVLGVEVTVAAIAPLRPGQCDDYTAAGIELLACPFPAASPFDHVENRARIALWLLGIEEALNPDVVHLTGYLHAGLPWCGKVLVAGYPGSGAAYGRLDAERRRICQAAFRFGLERADLVVAPTGTMMAALERNFGIAPGRVIRDGRDPARLAPSAKEPVVLSAGGLRENPARACALERAAPRVPWPVVAAGEQEDAEGSPIRLDGVSAPGWLSPVQLSEWFRRSAIYVAQAAEGAGTFVPEAALAGCALVLGDTAALRELWDGAAVFVPPDDSAAMAATLRALISAPRLREAMGALARRRAVAFPARAMAESYRGLYSGLIRSRARDQFADERPPLA